jgi:membrane-anchored mycosin MYCP
MSLESENGVCYESDQLVIELTNKDLVLGALRDWYGLSPELMDTSADLDLALINLPDLGPALARRPAAGTPATAVPGTPATAVAGTPARGGNAGGPAKPLDHLLNQLRADFRQRYHGWTATFGKNRLLDRVHGFPYLKGGLHDPVLATAADVQIGERTRPGGPRVGILDTRIYTHPRLAGRYIGNPLAADELPSVAAAGHATFIAGLILARAVDAQLIVDDVLDAEGESALSWDVAKKMVAFRDAAVAVLNLSFGCATLDNQPPFVLRRAVERLSPVMILVAAAGNHGGLPGETVEGIPTNVPVWPAALDDVVAVGALDRHGRVTSFTPDAQWIDLYAPGENVASTFLPGVLNSAERPNAYASWNGTSFAAANVCGAIAALMSEGYRARDALEKLLATGPGGGDIHAGQRPRVEPKP